MSPGLPRPSISWVRMSFICRPPSARRARVRQQRHLASVLDGGRDVALVLHAVPGDPAGADLAAVRDELAQQRGVLVVDVRALVLAEAADLLLRLANDLGHCGALFSYYSEPGSLSAGMVIY